MQFLMFAYLVLLLAGTLFLRAEGLLCYQCSVLGDAEDEQSALCLKSPWDIPGSVKTCLPHHKACKTTRIDHKQTGRLKSFVRGCSFSGKDRVETEQNYVISHRYCYTNKCNTGDGTDSDKDDQNKRITAILVRDMKGSGHQNHIAFISLPLVFIFTILFY